jgi:hypothetical protein
VSYQPETVTLRDQVHHLVSSRRGRGMSLDFICGKVPGFSRQQVRDSLKHLVKTGQLIRHGTIRYPLYQLLAPNGALSVSMQILTASELPAPKAKKSRSLTKTANVTWPDAVTVQHVQSALRLRGSHWRGTDWSQSVQRPGCQDHLLILSRRGDRFVAHRGPMGIRGASSEV